MKKYKDQMLFRFLFCLLQQIRLLVLVVGLTVISWGSPLALQAQVGHGGQPFSLPATKAYEAGVPVERMPALPQSVAADRAAVQAGKGQPLRFAHPFFVNYNPQNSGIWQQRKDGTRVWRLALQSPGAYSLNLIFDRFSLAESDSLYLYNPSQEVVLGAFTQKNNQASGVLATAPIPGDEIIVELVVAASSKRQSDLLIAAVNHDYLNVSSLLALKNSRFGRRGTCHADVSCEEDPLIQAAGQAVCRLIIDGTELCSGTLMNNSRNDGTPYVLTAAHCLPGEDSHNTVVFTFNYQVPNCNAAIEGSFVQTVSGSSRRAFKSELDMALLEMSELPPAAYRPYWAGWTRTQSPQAPVRSIHHPEGDVKSVSRSASAPVATTFQYFAPQGHWQVARWEEGTTQGGSSGGGLFDAEGKLIGYLSGGWATCSDPVNDYFGRLGVAWDYIADAEAQLAAWLDPEGTHSQSLEGTWFYSEPVERWSNQHIDETAGWWAPPTGGGPYSGHNAARDVAFAEMYGTFAKAKLHGFYVVPARSPLPVPEASTQQLNLKIWQGVDAPEDLIWSANNLRLSQLPDGREYLVSLAAPLEVSGQIWVGMELNYPAGIDSFALYQSPYSLERVNTAWLRGGDGQWLAFDERYPDVGPASFWVDVLLSEVELLDTLVAPPAAGAARVVPNPLRGNTLTLLLPEINGHARVSIYTLSGQRVQQQQVLIYNGRGTLTTGTLAPGIYLLHLNMGERRFVEKLVVQ
ncbi:T9SS type A sorting domain-containing protein [Geofilum rhodophaeum]|uniref:T9SS type A sorting domain-containing protein n=1 Tax=Geofilum rhodophaeum TaxID=1965019 RepID=UPI000B525E89|nr:T9SS type A sorting domain-containing protein [Geofilum rhodophaeum]